jgi:aminoglycoside phosphotransferase (APT) family kinase protein
MPAWDADVEITTALVVALVEHHFPALKPVKAEYLGEGWDNVAYRINDDLAFRFPRRKLGAEALETEIRFLPQVANYLILPVSTPEWIGGAAFGYPYRFAGYRLILGEPSSAFDLGDDDREACTEQLAGFLRELHDLKPPEDAPTDLLRRSNLEYRLNDALRRIERLGLDLAGFAREIAQMDAWHGPPKWLHGDFHPRQFLIHDGTVSGVIDWGDMHAGDPALDLSIGFTFLPPQARASFRAAYGPIDDATWSRARFRALYEALIFLEHAQIEDDIESRRIGEFTLRNIRG